MEDNLLANILLSKEKIKECLDTPINIDIDTFDNNTFHQNNIHDQASIIPPINNQITNDQVQVDEAAPKQSSTTQSSFQAFTMESQLGQFNPDLEDSYIVNIIGVEQKKEGGLMKQTYLDYILLITRLDDGTTITSNKRFRDIKAWYYELINEYEEIQFDKNIVFPDYSDGWLSSSKSSDPNSQLVVRRKADLQCFFFELFKQYPVLFHSRRVKEFLELKRFTPKASSTYSNYYSTMSAPSQEKPVEFVQPIVNNNVVEDLTKDKYIYNPNRGMIELRDDYYDEERDHLKAKKYHDQKMSLVDFMTFNEKMMLSTQSWATSN